MAITQAAKSARVQSYNVVCVAKGTDYQLYVCPSNCRAEITMLMVNNVEGNTTLNVTWNDVSSATDVHIVGGKNLTAGDSILFTGATLVLEAGDTIVFNVAGSGTCHVDGLCTVTETFRPIG